MREENQTIIKALNMFGRVPEQYELLNEIERLNNIINELEKELKEYLNRIEETKIYVDAFHSQAIYNDIEHILNKLKELKESANNE